MDSDSSPNVAFENDQSANDEPNNDEKVGDTILSEDDPDTDNSDDWAEMDASHEEQTTCLFCPSQFLTIAVALDHCRTEHKFDLLELKTKFNMDCYSYIKMINYIRTHTPKPKDLVEAAEPLWNDETYLQSGEMETWLMYDFDHLGSAPATPNYALEGKMPVSSTNLADLHRQVSDLNLQIRNKDMLLDIAMKDIEKMREVAKVILESGEEGEDEPPLDTSYFSSYTHFGIHYEMLNDEVRTKSYRDAILNNQDSFNGKVVLDVGCGTGILSMFSAAAGASKVIGIDESEIIFKAMDIIRENNLEMTVQLIKGRIENITLPVKKVDIIVSEWMGYFLLYEGMLESFVRARNKYLKTCGHVLPSKCIIYLVGCSNLDRYNKVINFWDNVYGFSMKCMKPDVLSEAVIETVPPETIVTEPVILTEINLRYCSKMAAEFTSDFKLKATKDCTLTSLVGYFDTVFDLNKPVQFSTGPQAQKTHWQQTVFYLENVVNLKQDETIEGTLACSSLKRNARGLLITINLGQNKYVYNLD